MNWPTELGDLANLIYADGQLNEEQALQLLDEISDLRRRLAAMTAARNEACYRWAQCRNDEGLNEKYGDDPHIEKLRKVGGE